MILQLRFASWRGTFLKEIAKCEAQRAGEERIERKQWKSVKERSTDEQQRRKRKTYKERMSERDACRPPRLLTAVR